MFIRLIINTFKLNLQPIFKYSCTVTNLGTIFN